MSPQCWRQSILALRVPSFNSSAKTCVQGTVTAARPSQPQIILITWLFIMALTERDVQRFMVFAVYTSFLFVFPVLRAAGSQESLTTFDQVVYSN